MKLEDLTPKQRLKAEKWLAIIRECINSDLSNEEWCEQNNVSIKSYYYYLAKLRKMAIEQIPYKKRNNVLPLVPESNDIVEIQASQSTPVHQLSCGLVAIQRRKQFRAYFSSVQRNDKGFLYGIFFDMILHFLNLFQKR